MSRNTTPGGSLQPMDGAATLQRLTLVQKNRGESSVPRATHTWTVRRPFYFVADDRMFHLCDLDHVFI